MEVGLSRVLILGVSVGRLLATNRVVGAVAVYAAALVCVAGYAAEDAGVSGRASRPARAVVKPPYTAENFPDWSGVWSKVRAPDVPYDADTAGVGTRAPSPIDYQPEYAARYAAVQEKVRQGIPISLPATECLPLGMPYMLYTGYPMQIMMTPGLVTMITEYGGWYRNIHIDLPMPEDTPPTFAGYSRGHWEGDTLVVRTIGMRADTTLDANGLPHSEALTLTERYREINPGTLEVKVTMEDAKAFRKPYTRVTHWLYEPDWVLNEYICLENNRNPVDEEGNTLTILK